MADQPTLNDDHDRGRLRGTVALITGAARGQGASHARFLAAEGADLILLDAVTAIAEVGYPMPGPAELKQVMAEAEELGARVITIEADTRDLPAVEAAVTEAVFTLGRLDTVVANAGVLGEPARTWELTQSEWDSVIGVNLTGVWATLKAATPHMISAGNGGSIILISSIAGLRGVPGVSNYVASKHALVGLAGSLANEVAEYGIRVNTIHPTNVRTPMIDNPVSAKIFRPDLDDPTLEDGIETLRRINLFADPWVEEEDISAAVVWLASNDSRFVTGAAIPVDAGMLAKYSG